MLQRSQNSFASRKSGTGLRHSLLAFYSQVSTALLAAKEHAKELATALHRLRVTINGLGASNREGLAACAEYTLFPLTFLLDSIVQTRTSEGAVTALDEYSRPLTAVLRQEVDHWPV